MWLGRYVAFDALRRGLLARVRVDGDPPRLHLLGDLPLEIDDKQNVLQFCSGYADVIGEFEATSERPQSEPMMEILNLLAVGLRAIDHQQIRLMGDRKLVPGEAGDRYDDAIGILTNLGDVIGRPSCRRFADRRRFRAG